MKISGNDLFVTAMKKEGVDTIFAYPGGMVVNLLDALHDCHSIDLVLPRHEQGLIMRERQERSASASSPAVREQPIW